MGFDNLTVFGYGFILVFETYIYFCSLMVAYESGRIPYVYWEYLDRVLNWHERFA